jgi:glycosyltransferase involved in cell wall biosynthesis
MVTSKNRKDLKESMGDLKEKLGHILFIVENSTVPVDIRVWREARVAKETGLMVSVVSPRKKEFQKPYENIDGIDIYRHPTYGHSGSMQGQILEYLVAFLWEMVLSIRIYKNKPFDIIHVANPPDSLFIIGLVFKLFGTKLIFDHHDLSPELFASKYNGGNKWIIGLLNIFEFLSCKCADVVISTNDSFKRHVVEKHGVEQNKIFVVRNDPETDCSGESPKIEQGENSDGAVTLIYVGAINEQDGVHLLVEAIDILVKKLKYQKVKCKVVGDGNRLSQIKSQAKELGLEESFEFMGFVYDRRLVKNYISQADICVETAPDSACNRKSTFIKIMEYMACGKAVVAFDLPETRISTGESAILVEPGNISKFAEEICKLAKDSAKRQVLGAMARERIVNRLNWNNSSKMLASVYRKLSDQ